MTRFTKILMGATALSMMAGVAFAQSNEAYIEQGTSTSSGRNNTAFIDQNGVNGGNSLGFNRAGSMSDPMLQDGRRNEIDIIQVGDLDGASNVVGTNENGASDYTGPNAGVDQIGNGNELDVYQEGRRIRLLEVQQDGNQNSARTSQDGNSNSISSINQSDNGNRAVVEQIGNTNTFGRSAFRAQAQVGQNGTGAVQSGSDNVLVLIQEGGNNITSVISQATTGAGNQARLVLRGDRNGNRDGNAGADGFVGGFASGAGFDSRFVIPGVEQGAVFQSGENTLDFRISGSDNLYGFTQTGTSNIDGVARGNFNDISVGQIGNNAVVLDVFGDFNNVGVNQQTNSSTSAFATANVMIDGSNNNLGVSQGQSGNATSSLDVQITGDFNNNNGAGFTGDAADVFFSRTPGLIEQGGSNNEIALVVDGDSNLFSLRQASGSNSITGSIEGDFNQAVVSQSGLDVANFSQNGNFNNIGIQQ